MGRKGRRMKTNEFCYWLMGSLELNENEGFDEKQTKVLKNHLNMVFVHMVNDDGTLKDEIRYDGKEIMEPKVNC